MRIERVPDESPGKSPHERFTELGKKLMAVPKSEVDKRDAKWQARKRIKPGPKKRR
jgi:hypothetical protein